MKYSLCILPFLMLLLFSCDKKSSPSAFTPSNLASTFILLNPDAAYKLKTPKGAIINIGKNTFSTKEKVQLEIKEAYGVQDILLAGLTTESNGKALKSAGMIYFSATANGTAVKILQPIDVSIPGEVYDKNMQLFKGEIKDDSSINWIDPKVLDSSPVAKNIAAGEAMFKANCANCHKPLEDYTGGALAACRQRAPYSIWPYKFVNNVNTMLETDAYAKKLFYKYGSKMTQFNLPREDLKAIFDYCDNEAALNPGRIQNTVPIPGSTDTTTKNSMGNDEPCNSFDTIYYPKPDTGIIQLPATNYQLQDDSINSIPEPEDFYKKNGYDYLLPDEGAYQFSITSNGWYNIDCFIEDNRGLTKNVELTALLKMTEEFDMHVYLCIPDRKLLTKAGYHKGNEYIFKEADGSIPLILNDEALVIAVGSYKDKMYYGISKFTVQMKQTIPININASSKEGILDAILKNNMDGIKIDIDKKEMEILKKPCDEAYPIEAPVAGIIYQGKGNANVFTETNDGFIK